LSPNIVLAFDADKAGFNAANRASKIALSFGMDVKVTKLPEGVDPADLISKSGVDAWREAIRSSKHIIEFLLDKVLKDFENDPRKMGREIKEKILPYVDAIDSAIEQAHFIKKISDISQISEQALKDDLAHLEKEFKTEKEEIRRVYNIEDKMFRKDYIERRLLGIILWQKTLPVPKIDMENIIKEICLIFKTDETNLFDRIKDNKEDLIFEAEVFYGEDNDLGKDVLELLFNLKEESLKEEQFHKMQELRIYESKKENEKVALILKEINEINQKIQIIKNSRLKIKS